MEALSIEENEILLVYFGDRITRDYASDFVKDLRMMLNTDHVYGVPADDINMKKVQAK